MAQIQYLVAFHRQTFILSSSVPSSHHIHHHRRGFIKKRKSGNPMSSLCKQFTENWDTESRILIPIQAPPIQSTEWATLSLSLYGRNCESSAIYRITVSFTVFSALPPGKVDCKVSIPISLCWGVGVNNRGSLFPLFFEGFRKKQMKGIY